MKLTSKITDSRSGSQTKAISFVNFDLLGQKKPQKIPSTLNIYSEMKPMKRKIINKAPSTSDLPPQKLAFTLQLL